MPDTETLIRIWLLAGLIVVGVFLLFSAVVAVLGWRRLGEAERRHAETRERIVRELRRTDPRWQKPTSTSTRKN
jgi:hypothetical protein